MMRLALIVAIAAAVPAAQARAAGEIGFVEDFALARDRAVPLAQLIPGTEEYYYYHCLHHQNTGRLGKVDDLLELWIARYKRTARVREIENRQALLRYDDDPKASLAFLRSRLGLRFSHQRERLDRKPNLPTSLDEKRIHRDTLARDAFARHRNSLGGFEDAALEWLAARPLSPQRRRDLLRRLTRPDVPGLPKLVVDDLKSRLGGSFGSLKIHRKLLRAQLDQCLKLKADLIHNTNFVNAYIAKLQPGPDEDFAGDPKVRRAYFDRLWTFAARLAPAFNSLKANALHARLVFDRSRGVYDKGRFMTYIKLPRNVRYINPEYMKVHENRRWAANLGADYRKVTGFGPIRTDEGLIRSFLAHFFVREDSYKPYAPYLRDDFVAGVFAETKILHGIGDQEKWYSLLGAGAVKALKERVDLDFAWTNKEMFGPDEKVGLDVHVKNVNKLIVKVFRINALNYYRDNGREVDLAVNLDGLVANAEEVHTYDLPALRRVKRRFEFPALARPGVYVVELIGNGKSSRALIRKGKLRHAVRTSVAGQVFTVLDESDNKIADARLYLGGREYAADEDGEIVVPYTNKPQRVPVVLAHGDFASLDYFNHQSETYALQAGMYVDREALLTRKKASVLIRPSLTVNGIPAPLSVLKEVTLAITSTDLDGVNTTKEAPDFKLAEDRDSPYEFLVPDRLTRMIFTLKAKVEVLSQGGKKVDLAASASFTLNGILRTEKVEDLHLVHAGGKYFVDVLGRSGERRPDRPLHLRLKHREFKRAADVVLQTDAAGRLTLGALPEIDWVEARGPEGTSHRWRMLTDDHTQRSNVHGRVGKAVLVPYMGAAARPRRTELSLLEVKAGTYVTDWFKALSIRDGFVVIDDLPAGDYELYFKRTGRLVHVRLTAGQDGPGYVVGRVRRLQVRNPLPLQIVDVTAGRRELKIRLANASKYARVHVLATRYMPEYAAYSRLGAIGLPEPGIIGIAPPRSLYQAGRNIGDEYRYILDRKYAAKYPGNMLKRPELLLNPWAIRKTEAQRQAVAPGAAYRGKRDAPALSRFFGTGGKAHQRKAGNFANYDFLPAGSAVLVNLAPDAKGVVTIARKDLGDHQQIHVVAVDPENLACREVSLAEQKLNPKPLQLAVGLDPAGRFAQKKQISVVRKGEKFTLADIASSKFEVYDTLAKVHKLYVTLSPNANLVEFGFVTRWDKLKPAEKRQKYSKYACHELNFFLSRKDPEFFRTVVKPYLANKKDKTYLDHWLIEADLGGYLQPWAHGQLNIVEQILLGRRIAAERAATARFVKERFDLIPPDVERFNRLFDTALKAGALETADQYGVAKVREKLEREVAAADKPARLAGRLLRAARSSAARGGARAPTTAPPGEALARKALAEDLAAEVRVGKRDGTIVSLAGARTADGKWYELLRYPRDKAKRGRARQYYRKLDKTREWVENNYYHLPIARQNASLVTVQGVWADYAAHDGDGPFLSTKLAEASRNFTEMMLALAALDLPFEAGKHKSAFKDRQFTLDAAGDLIVYHQEIKPVKPAADKTPILVSQNFFRRGDRYRHVNNEKLDKFVTDEFLVHVVYGCHVVITNPTSSRQKLDVLLQVPRGAIPVLAGRYTRSVHMVLDPYRTSTLEYYFYFPAPGEFAHYPVSVARNERHVASAQPATLKVVRKLSRIDKASWDYISQHGSDEQVMRFLADNNLNRHKLPRIAFRMRDKRLFRRVLALLGRRHLYDQTLWSYGIYHNDLPAMRQYLQHNDGFVRQCGPAIACTLLTIDPVIRKAYQHVEYSPLVNARAHQLGKRRRIVNARLLGQYHALMSVLACRPALDDDDLMAVTYYMLLQDRVEDALAFFSRVDAAKLATRLQYDYFDAYMDFYTPGLATARAAADRYRDHPVDRWRKAFANVAVQLDEIAGRAAGVADAEDRTQQQTKLAATAPSLDFKVEAKKITIDYRNLTSAVVNYYLMDIELLFSRQPFVKEYAGQFAYIQPNATATVKLPADEATHAIDLPKQFHNANVMIEIVAGGVKKSRAYYSNALNVQVIANYGQVRVAHAAAGKALPKVYVKVYARMRDGRVKFYKDGYTDLRGLFDYTSLNTNELDNVHRFALLILSDNHGAVVREASPPKR